MSLDVSFFTNFDTLYIGSLSKYNKMPLNLFGVLKASTIKALKIVKDEQSMISML